MLASLSILLLCQLAGEITVRLLGVPLPGPVVGMVILFIGLLIRGRVPVSLEQSVRAILANFALLFIPASVGVMVHLAAIWTEIIPIAVGVLGSMVITLVIAGRLMQALSKDQPKADLS